MEIGAELAKLARAVVTTALLNCAFLRLSQLDVSTKDNEIIFHDTLTVTRHNRII